MVGKTGHDLMPWQAQAVEEEQQEHRRVRYELRQITPSGGDRQEERQCNRDREQPHHRIDPREH